jgi:hypothetical protein
MIDQLNHDPDELEASETAAQLLIAQIKRMKAAGIEFRIRDGNGVWVVTINFESLGRKPN